MRPLMTAVAAAPLVVVTMTATSPTPPAGSSSPPDASAEVLDAGPLGEPTLLEVDGHLDSVSPDGGWIAGTGTDGTPCIWDIESLEATCASDPVKAANDPSRSSMAWSPDSQRVAFTPDVFVRALDGDVFVMDLEGTLTNLTDDGYEGGFIGADAPADLAVDSLPTWSPDGSRIAFIRDAAGTEVSSIMTIDPAGGEPTEVGASPVASRFAVWPSIAWVADDSILFTTNPADPNDPGHGVWTLDPSTAVVTEIVSASRRTFELTDVAADGSTALVVDPVAIGQASYDPAADGASAVVAELDLATGELTGRPALDLATTTFGTTPDDAADLLEGVTIPTGPQAYSPDGTMWTGTYWTPSQDQYLVVGDVVSGEVVGVVNLTERDLAAGASAIQWVDGGIFAKSSAGRAVWIPTDGV